MAECNNVVESFYKHSTFNALMEKVRCKAIRDDLRQEIALRLLTQPCEKITALFARNELIRYATRICWILATSERSQYSDANRVKQYLKAIDYMNDTTELPDAVPVELAYEARMILDGKTQTVSDDHERRIFSKFVELGSARKVANYYHIPVNHCCNIINKVKSELKCILLS